LAYTFPEALAESTNNNMLARCTLVIEQDDSRTGWGRGYLWFDGAGAMSNIGATNEWDFAMQFSDRKSGNEPWFSGDVDRIEMAVKPDGTSFDAKIVLKTWGDTTFTVRLKPSPVKYSKMLTGWGPVIGQAKGRALYVLSFNELIPGIT
jgi:hypothetical protein